MAEKFVFYMNRMTKTYPPGKTVLKDISLSFYYGAKIGIIGTNGSGKSTLLRIMAGIDKEFQGEAWIESGRTAVTCRRSQSSIRISPSRITSCRLSRKSRRFSTATTKFR